MLSQQCLDRRFHDAAAPSAAAATWEQGRNHAPVTVDRRFTAEDARIKLKHLYPSHQP